jgi:DedD protein
MNHLLEPDLESGTHDYAQDREISLGLGTILGLFFVLALICACFFGFGYSVGRRSALAAAIPATVIPTPATNGATKPSAGSAVPTASAAETPAVPVSIPADAAMAAAPKPQISQVPAAAAVQGTAPVGVGSFMVQVAAVSSQDVADIEVSALKKDGYAVVVRHEPQDKLLHVQIGPFADKKDAEAMRQRVIGDGFNAIVK